MAVKIDQHRYSSMENRRQIVERTEDRTLGPCAYATPKLTRRIAANTSARLSARPGKSRWQ
ncbi:MAG: hypothetical protein LBD06_02130 [Candidatus Accumulibacter sp.]|nr:hypothetical protein [Accumulibacter sp.]